MSEWNRIVVTDDDVMQLEMGFLFILFFRKQYKKSNAGLLKQMCQCLRNNFFYLALGLEP